MVEGAKRSGRFAKKNVVTPGGRNKRVFSERNPNPARCGGCGAVLKGIPRDVQGLSKTQKRPERPFGGVLCGSCMREEIKLRVRA
jgi:large subunit ribosomal protein L34e